MRNADGLRALEADLRGLFGSRLRALVTYGASDSSEAPLATLAVVDRLTPEDLRRSAARVADWTRRQLATPLFLESGEFDRSLDVFPFEFGAILADYHVVSGDDPFIGLQVDPDDVRRACEVQARSHLIHLREGFLETGGRTDAVSNLIVRSAAPLATLLKHVERLRGTPMADPVLTRVAELAHGGTLSSDEAERLFDPYLTAVYGLVDALDRWSVA